MKLFKIVALCASLTLVTACGGGSKSVGGGGSGSSSSSTDEDYIYDNIADPFVDDLFSDDDYSYDDDYDDDYDYSDDYSDDDYYADDDYDYSDDYEEDDYYYEEYTSDSGIIFEKTQKAPKDRLKLAATTEAEMLENATSKLTTKYGLSQERSYEVAKLAVIWQKTPKTRMTIGAYDEFTKSLFGHTVTDIESAVTKKLSGQKEDFNQIIEDAAELNGVTPDHMNQIVDTVFGVAWR